MRDASVVDADVKLSPPVDHLLNHTLDLIGLGHIRQHHDCLNAGCLERFAGFMRSLFIYVNYSHLCTCLTQCLGISESDTHGATGNQGYPAIQPESVQDRFGCLNVVAHMQFLSNQKVSPPSTAQCIENYQVEVSMLRTCPLSPAHDDVHEY
jgi:hypothetical protein